MSGSAHFKSVPIIDVTKENVAIVGPMMRGGIIGSDFIAIDCVRISMKIIEQIIIFSLKTILKLQNTGYIFPPWSIRDPSNRIFKPPRGIPSTEECKLAVFFSVQGETGLEINIF